MTERQFYISSFDVDNNIPIKEQENDFNSIAEYTFCSFVRSQVLFTAIRLNIFTTIHKSATCSLTIEELVLKLNIKLKLSYFKSYLTYLVYLRLLKLTNENKYECTNVTRKYLVQDKDKQQWYIADGIQVWDKRLYQFCSYLDKTLRSGKRSSEQNQCSNNLWSVFEQKQDIMLFFAHVMASFTRCTTNELCDHFDFSCYQTLVDLGGSLGDLSRTVVARNENIKCYSAELPELCQYIQTNIHLYYHERIEYICEDIFEQQWSDSIENNIDQIDIVCLKYILHDWTYKQRQFLVNKVYNLLKRKSKNENGLMLVIEKMVDDKRSNLSTLCTSVSMLIELGDGTGYDGTLLEYKQLVQDCGFKTIQLIKLNGPMVAMCAYLK